MEEEPQRAPTRKRPGGDDQDYERVRDMGDEDVPQQLDAPMESLSRELMAWTTRTKSS